MYEWILVDDFHGQSAMRGMIDNKALSQGSLLRFRVDKEVELAFRRSDPRTADVRIHAADSCVSNLLPTTATVTTVTAVTTVKT